MVVFWRLRASLVGRLGAPHVLVKHHGEDTPGEAAMRADAVLEGGSRSL